jgi:hypothetical protein
MNTETIAKKKKLIREGLYRQALELPPDTNMGEIGLRISAYVQEANSDHEFVQMLNNVRNFYIANTKKLIREGLYWQALKLPPDTNMGEIDLRIFGYVQVVNNDREFVQMLNNVRRHFSNNSYQKVYTEFWEMLSTKLDDNHTQPVLYITEENISRETVWGNQIEPTLDLPDNSSIKNAKSSLVEHFRNAGFELAEKGQSPPQQANTSENWTIAIKALKKSVYCLDIAYDYANNKIITDSITKLRNQAKDIENSMEYLAKAQGYAIPEWPEIPVQANIPVNQPVISNKPNISTGTTPTYKPATPKLTFVHSAPVKPAAPKLTPVHPSPVKPAPVTSTQTKSQTPKVKKSHRKWGVALALAIIMGWSGADRAYLGHLSTLLKMGIFAIAFLSYFQPPFSNVPGLFGLAVIIDVFWWVIDIILIASRRLKDHQGLALK